MNAEHPRLQKPIHDERQVKVVCIGAGASGLLFAYKLQRSFENFKLTLYEKNGEISGTWYENKYPGCACDAPAHNYTWSFEPYADWSAMYAGSDEINAYFQEFSKKYSLQKYTKLKHQVTRAQWDNVMGIWELEVNDLNAGKVIKDECHFLINASGVLNAWKWPAIPGLADYKGQLLHTARWDRNIDLTGKHVGLIGNGSSAIQLLPAISSKANKITNFIREPTWISPVFGMEQRIFSGDERREFAKNPKIHLEFRRACEAQINSAFHIFFPNSEMQNLTKESMVSLMKERLQNKPTLAENLIPPWPVGCRRITPGSGYLETLASEKVNVVYGGIEKVTDRGCVSNDGKEYVFDVLVCATGFDTSFRPRFPIVGLEGKNLAEEWAQEPKGYLGVAAPWFPNYFVFIGPNSPVGNGPVLIAVEAQADFMLKLINRWQTENIHSMTPKLEAVEEFNAHKDQFMAKTVWAKECRSWYKSNSITGKVTALWPGSTLHYLEAIAEPRYDDWNITYSGNRFSFLGNGFSQTEIDPTADWGYYVRNADDSPFVSRGKSLKVMNKSGTVQKPPNPIALLISEDELVKSKL